MPTLRSALRTLFEVMATGTGLTRAGRLVHRSRIAILAYHNVIDPAHAGRGDSSLHIPLPRFLEQLDVIRSTHGIVDLDGIHDSAAGNRPRAVITFDDAYRGAVTLALPELIRREIPATMFVSPGLLGAEGTWWDLMAEAGLLSNESRGSALRTGAGMGGPITRRAFATSRPPELPHSFGIADAEEIRRHCHTCISLGSHAWGHEYLPALERTPLRETLQRTMQWLAEHRGPVSKWLALPYGGASTTVTETAFITGHCGVLRIDGGLWSGSASGQGDVPRINVPSGMTSRGLALRMSGVVVS